MDPITIDPCILVTGFSMVVSAVVTWFVTWYFSKRRYSRLAKPITEADIELERVKNEHRGEIVGATAVVILMLVIVGFFALMIILAN